MNAIETGLYAALSGDSDLTDALGGAYIYNQVAPQGKARPCVTFAHTGGGNLNINPSDLQGHVYLVKGIADAVKTAGEIDDLIKAVLHKGTLTVNGYTNISTLREDQIRYVETLDDGTQVFHAGGYYRVRIDD